MFKKLTYSIVIVITLTISLAFNARYTEQSSMLFGDALGYYTYLPATFIYHNLKHLETLPEDKDIPTSVLRYAGEFNTDGLHTKKGYVIDQYTYGIALMESPFFFIAHAYEKAKKLPANGYSTTYNNMMRVCTAFYALLGLLLCYVILKRYFNTIQALLAVVLIFLSTNLFWFSVAQPGMSHTFLFFLYALLMYLTIKVYEHPKSWLFATIGFIIGLIIVIRPTDILCIAIPLFYNVNSKQSLRDKLGFIKKHAWSMLLLAVAAIIPFIPQFAYWKMISGDMIFYSYGKQGFNWDKPKIIEGLFYFSNGWLPYSMTMIFALAGLVLYKYFPKWILAIIITLPIYIYIIYSWYCFNYINGLGSRPMIHMYPLLALPLAAFIKYISQRKLIVKCLFTLVCMFFIAVNYSFSMLKTKDMLNSETTNIRYCLSVLFKTSINYNDLVVNDVEQWQPDLKKITKVCTLDCEHFDDSISDHSIPDTSGISKYVYRMADEEEYLPRGVKIKYDKKVFGDAKWFKCNGRFMFTNWPVSSRYHLFELAIKRKDDFLLWKAGVIDNKVGLADNSCKHIPRLYTIHHFERNVWGSVYYFIRIPNGLEDGDDIIMDVWNSSKKEIYVDELCLELYK